MKLVFFNLKTILTFLPNSLFPCNKHSILLK